jgi:hypothetical protein
MAMPASPTSTKSGASPTIAAALILSARAVIGRGIAERVGAALILPSGTVKCRRVAEGIGAAQILPTGTIERPVLGQGCRRRQRKGNKRKCDQLHVYLPLSDRLHRLELGCGRSGQARRLRQ